MRARKEEGPSNLSQKSIFEDFDNFWRYMPTKWLQERPNGSKNVLGIGFEGPGVEKRPSAPLLQGGSMHYPLSLELTEVPLLL